MFSTAHKNKSVGLVEAWAGGRFLKFFQIREGTLTTAHFGTRDLGVGNSVAQRWWAGELSPGQTQLEEALDKEK